MQSRLWPGPRPLKPCATGRKTVKPAPPARIQKNLPGAEIAGESGTGMVPSGRTPTPETPENRCAAILGGRRSRTGEVLKSSAGSATLNTPAARNPSSLTFVFSRA